VGRGKVNCQVEPNLPGEIEGRQDISSVVFHNGAHFLFILLVHLVLLDAGQVGHEQTVFFYIGIFRTTQPFFVFPNQLTTDKTSIKAIEGIIVCGVTAMEAAIVPFLMEEYGISAFDHIFVDEIIILPDKNILAETGGTDQVPSHHDSADESEGGSAAE
jgi:hypothetical protein